MTPTTPSEQRLLSRQRELLVIEIVCENMGLNRSEVHPEDCFFDVVRSDSLDMVELVMALEEEFHVTMTDQWCEEAFTNPRTMTLRQLALAIGELIDSSPAPSPQPRLPATPVPESVPFMQLGGRASVAEWLDGPLYEVLGSNRNDRTEYRRRTDGMRCIQLPVGRVQPSSCDSSRAERVPVLPFVIDAEPVANRAFARFLNSIGKVPPNILLEWCGTAADDHRGPQFGLKRGWGTWVPLRKTDRQPVILVSWYGAAAYSLWAHRFDWRYYRGSNTIPSELQSRRVDAPPPRAADQCLPSELEWE
jgi:acyl carrier protein